MATTHPTLTAADRKSLALHMAVAQKLLENQEILSRARTRVAMWEVGDTVHPWYVQAWADVLGGSAEQVAAFLANPSEDACAMRQASPFAGALEVGERNAVLREFRNGEPHEPRAA